MNLKITLYPEIGIDKKLIKVNGKKGEVKTVESLEDLDLIISHEAYSTYLFDEAMGRQEDAFLSTSLLALDYDDGTPRLEVIKKLKELKLAAVVRGTQNDRVDKDGTGPKERFRVLLILDKVIRDLPTLFFTYRRLTEIFGTFDWGASSKWANRLYGNSNQVNQYRQPASNQLRAIRDGNTIRYFTSNGVLVKYSIM